MKVPYVQEKYKDYRTFPLVPYVLLSCHADAAATSNITSRQLRSAE